MCGFVVKSLPIKNCNDCKKIFIAENSDESHIFVDCKEYNEFKKILTYVTKDTISCVEYCASLINLYLKENGHKQFIKKTLFLNMRENVNFDFKNKCTTHNEQNINIIINSVFCICIKRFTTLKNRALAEQATASALKRKMDIILHKLLKKVKLCFNLSDLHLN